MLRNGDGRWLRFGRVVALAVMAGFVGLAGLSPNVVQARSPVSVGTADTVTASQLPPQGRDMLALIYQGGPFRYDKDGTVFGNRERMLPAKNRGYYREYTVRTPGARDRGARRIIAGRGGEYYYTDDHYRTFRRIRE